MTIKELRGYAHMTQKKFAEYFGIPQRTVEGWENGRGNAPTYLLDLMEYKLRAEELFFTGHEGEARWAFLCKKKIVEAGESKVLKDWQEHSTITAEDFISALEWLCQDPLDEHGRTTREIALAPTSIKRLEKSYGEVTGIAGYWEIDTGKRWEGEFFDLQCTELEKKRYGADTKRMCVKAMLNAKDRI